MMQKVREGTVFQTVDADPGENAVFVRCQGWLSFEFLARKGPDGKWYNSIKGGYCWWHQIALKVVDWRYP